MNIRRTCDLRAPIDIRTAMSRVFSITIMVSEIRMFSAATKTIRPMVMKVTNRLQAQGVKERLVLLHPVGGHVAFAGGLLQFIANLVGFVDVVHLEFQHRNQIAQSKQCCASDSRVKAHVLSES